MTDAPRPTSSGTNDQRAGDRPARDRSRGSAPRKRKPRAQTYIHRNRRVQIPTGYMAVGLITSAHGLRGDVKIELHTDFPERFAPDTVLYLDVALTEMTLEAARPHQGGMLLKFAGVDDRTEAETLRGQWLFIPEEAAQTLEEDTYFVHDIVGLTVETAEGRVLGKVSDVLFTGANEVYIVQSQDDPPREILLPAIADVIQRVDLAAGRMIVTPLPGLLDE